MMKVAVRVDGGPNIGMGHIQRCLALSSQLKKNGAEIFFVSKKNNIVKRKVKQEGFEVITLKDHIDLKENLRDTINAIKTCRADVVITDSYAINEHYLTEIKKTIPLLVSIDDLAKVPFPSDIVINQNVYAKDLKYRFLTGNTKFLLGPEYALLREEFADLSERKINKKVQNILITLGGSDPFNVTPKILNVLDRIQEDFNITVAIAYFFNNISEIEETVKKMSKRVELIYNSSQMASLMLSSDLAIAGGGTTLYEIAATGTPTLAFCLADNQEKNVRGMAKTDTVIDIGWRNQWKRERFYGETNELINNHLLRQKMSKMGQDLVNGGGAERASKKIIETFNELRNRITP